MSFGGSAFDPTQSLFASMSTQTLQANLAAAQAAYMALSSGTQVVQATYTQGDGSKAVTYRQTDLASIAALIRTLQVQLGIIPRGRRPMRPLFV